MLIVIAQKEELKLVEELGYSDYPVLITGVGGINVIKALKDLPKDTEILNIGYCGSNFFEVGTQLVIKDVKTNHDIAIFEEHYTDCKLIGGFKQSTCYTSTDFVVKTENILPCVFDMELAFIRAMFDNVSSIKVVSDKLSKKDYDDYVS